MNDSSRPPKPLIQVLPMLVVAAVPLAAFLGLSLAFLLGKRLLPVYGGTFGGWLGCVTYGQLALLLGQVWAAWLRRRDALFQTAATAVLSLLAVLTFHLPDNHPSAGAGLLQAMWRLALSSLPAVVLLASVSPVLQGWLRRRGQEVPPYLYALSSVAALGAVFIYPFVIEPALRVSNQGFYWEGGLIVLAGLLAASAYIFKQTAGDSGKEPVSGVAPSTSLGLPLLWLCLSGLTCVSLLGASYYRSMELGSTPLAWTTPLTIYLLSIVVTFSGHWRRWMTLTTVVWLAASLTGFLVAKQSHPHVNGGVAPYLFSLAASGAFLGHALLQSLRPALHSEKFLFWVATGGLLGAAAAATIIPRLLPQPIELELASAGLLVMGMLWLVDRHDPAVVAVTAGVLVIPVLGLIVQQRYFDAAGGVVRRERDFHGNIFVRTDARWASLTSYATTRGTQLLTDAASRRRPTLYYTESSGLGRVLQKLQAARPRMNVGVIGLGAGTLAAYARADDTYDFWENDPKVLRAARESFTYVAEAAGRINLVPGDGRQALEESKTDYDLIVVDAFTGDGPPAYLLTREAMSAYLNRLNARDGLLVIHAQANNYTFFPVIEASVRTLAHSALNIITEIKETTADRDLDPRPTEYVVVCRPEKRQEIVDWAPAEEDGGRVTRKVQVNDSVLVNSQLIWSDDRSAASDALDMPRFMAAH
ncbi:MAG TPA: fused MFS/spermidine synthase [Opitutaceae bacterium]|nr:fused MFS/spermidine synthase [Opitutaceae bacterium]